MFVATPHDTTTATASTAHGGLVDKLLADTQPVDQVPLPKVAATPVVVVPAGAGPFNAAASLSTKVTRKILALEFVEMAEITVDPDMPQVPGRPPPPACPPIYIIIRVSARRRPTTDDRVSRSVRDRQQVING